MKKNYFLYKLALLIAFAIGYQGASAQTTFNYTGSVQSYTVGAGVTSLCIDVRAASGGNTANGGAIDSGGKGARVECSIPVTPGQVLSIYVGGIGGNGSFSTPAPGGYNGGGNAGYLVGSGGGGASDIRTGGVALSDRIVVAGGGGGGGSGTVPVSGYERGGDGGGVTGQNGYYNNVNTGAQGGRGGTSTAGGAAGIGTSGSGLPGALGTGGNGNSASYAGAGGGGYYGGGGGGSFSAGGGGSSYAVATASGVLHTSGYNRGNGMVIITAGTTAGTISGGTSVTVGSTITLSSTVTGGTWSSSATSVATVSASGVVTGIAAGTAVITYAVSGCGGMVYATTTITVIAANCITGDVLFSTPGYYHNVKVWLIKYDPGTLMLTACDSVVVPTTGGTTAHYSFCGMGTDSFRVKAACDTMMTTSGYIPTYHNASAYWNSATVINHISGLTDAGKDITMAHGVAPSGPGFIAGNVTTGANKGTSGIPAVGLLVYCVDNATGAVLQQTITDAAGHYTFTGLPVGQVYKIYPELINYVTTPYPGISLTSGSPSMSIADFVQHTISHTITPLLTAVDNASGLDRSVRVFPNPAMDNVTIQTDGVGYTSLSISNSLGQQLIKQTLSATQTSVQVNIELLPTGLYYVQLTGPAGSVVAKFVKR